jgi:hypothetical protein
VEIREAVEMALTLVQYSMRAKVWALLLYCAVGGANVIKNPSDARAT